MSVQYERYNVGIKIRDKIIGGIPKHPEVIKGWIDAKMSKTLTKEERKELAQKTAKEMDVGEEVKKSWNGFKSDEKGLYIENRYINALLKEAAYILELSRGTGSTIFKQILQHGLYVEPSKIYLKRNGRVLREPDGYEEKPLHVMGPLGPRDALKRYDYCEQVECEFTVSIIKPLRGGDARINEKSLRAMFEAGQNIGLASDRSQQHGKFDLVKFEGKSRKKRETKKKKKKGRI